MYEPTIASGSPWNYRDCHVTLVSNEGLRYVNYNVQLHTRFAITTTKCSWEPIFQPSRRQEISNDRIPIDRSNLVSKYMTISNRAIFIVLQSATQSESSSNISFLDIKTFLNYENRELRLAKDVQKNTPVSRKDPGSTLARTNYNAHSQESFPFPGMKDIHLKMRTPLSRAQQSATLAMIPIARASHNKTIFRTSEQHDGLFSRPANR